MAACERPYLDTPDSLEYPTETWAAQEMRKSDVFNYAARHCESGERERFMERARAFFDVAMRMLEERPSRVLARPRIILLTSGLVHAALQRSNRVVLPEPQPGTHRDFGRPVRFVPQKEIVRRRFKAVAATAAAAAMLVIALVLAA